MIASINKKLFLSSLLLATPAWSFDGLSTFSSMSPKFPCEKVLTFTDSLHRPAMNALWGTFGTDLSCLQQFTERNAARPHLVQFILSNESCRYFSRCFAGELARGLTSKSYNSKLEKRHAKLLLEIRNRVQSILDAADVIGNSNTRFILSIGLEDRLSEKAAKVLIDTILEIWPYEISRNTLKYLQRMDVRLSFVESHSLRPSCTKTTIANNDGNVLSNASSFEYRKSTDKCGVVFFWLPKLQGIESNKFVRPRYRSFKFPVGDAVLAKKFFK